MRPKTKRHTARWLFLFGCAAFAIAFAWGGWRVYSFAINIPDPQRISDRAVAESTKIYDRTGEILLYEIHGEEKRTVIDLERVPHIVRQATLAAEDIHFYEHHGIEWRGILRALFVNLKRGEISQGGSTITQQLVKKALLTDERTYTRKIKEAILSLLIERRYSKDDIFEMYLNQIPYGSNAYGIEAAAKTYFSKSTQDLTLAEAATLAALPKAPTYYSPYGSHRDELVARRNWTLDHMASAGFISREQGEEAKRADLSFAPPKQSIRAPHFVMYVREYINEKYGEEFVEAGGLKVITTLDAKLQEYAETVIREGGERNEKLVNAKNASLVAVDPSTGDILAMVGSRDYFDLANDGNVNVALRPRQPGSAFKPFVYAAAFQKGYRPETVLFDVPTEFNTTCNADGTPGPAANADDCYHPQNYDNRFRGPVSLRQALAQSLNIPSVKLLYLVGLNDAIETAKSAGLTTLTDPKRYGLSLVLGGAEVTLLEMTSAFGVFAQDGLRHPTAAILRIENARGAIFEQKKGGAYPAMDTEVARAINDVLSDNNARIPVFSPTSSLYFPNRRVAVKTGTTQDYRDAWTIGYTPTIATGVWVGNNNNTPMSKDGISVMIAAPIWRRFMDYAITMRPHQEFMPPTLIVPEKPVLRGLYRTGSVLAIDKTSRKIATAATPLELVEEVSFGEIKSILASVRKQDPEGNPPPDPYEDRQYHNWQQAIEAWLRSSPLPDAPPPTETDDSHTPEKQPRIVIVFPDQDVIPAGSFREVIADISASYPIKEIQLFINDQMTFSQTAPLNPGRMSFPVHGVLPEGVTTLRIVVYDEVQNKTTIEKVVTITQ